MKPRFRNFQARPGPPGLGPGEQDSCSWSQRQEEERQVPAAGVRPRPPGNKCAAGLAGSPGLGASDQRAVTLPSSTTYPRVLRMAA
jgi:hypothetical protein